MGRLLRNALKETQDNIAMEGWWTDPYSDGTTMAGSWKLAGAKFKELFKESGDRIQRREVDYKEILDEVKASRYALTKDIDIREAMSYVPLGKLVTNVAVEGEIIRNHTQMVRYIKELTAFGQLRREYFSAALLFLLELGDKHEPKAFKKLDVPVVKKILSQNESGRMVSNAFLGNWRLIDVASHLKTSIPPEYNLFVPKVENEDHQYKSAIDQHYKPRTKKECLELLDLFELYIRTWVLERKYQMQFTELAIELMDSPIAPLVNTLGRFFSDTENHALKTMKTVSRIVDYSIRRMR